MKNHVVGPVYLAGISYLIKTKNMMHLKIRCVHRIWLFSSFPLGLCRIESLCDAIWERCYRNLVRVLSQTWSKMLQMSFKIGCFAARKSKENILDICFSYFSCTKFFFLLYIIIIIIMLQKGIMLPTFYSTRIKN